MFTFGRARRLVRRIPRLSTYVLVFALTPLTVAAVAHAGARPPQVISPAAFDRQLPAPPVHDPSRPTAVVVAGNAGTESTDLLAPYEVLAASGSFNVYVVAPERRLSPLFPGGLDIIPHFSFAEYEQAIGADPDLLVVPLIAQTNAADAAVLSWLRGRAGEQTTVLTICTGAKVAADAGLLAGRRATSAYTALPLFEQSYPEVQWVRGQRYVEDGRLISSAGITSGVDATLYTLQRFLGREAAEETARRVSYPHTRYLDDRSWQVPDAGIVPPLPDALRWGRTDIGVALYDGVREIEVGSIVDTYPHSNATDTHTIAPERRVVRSRHGLDLVPRFDLASAPALDRVLVPGRPDPAVFATTERWAAPRDLVAERVHASGGYPYDLTVSDLARQQTRPVAASVARDLEYPIDHLRLEGSDWPLGLLVQAIALGLLGLVLASGLDGALRGRRRPTWYAGSGSGVLSRRPRGG